VHAAYPTTYRDAHGEIATTIENDGQTLRVSLREVEFQGSDFDSLEPVRWSDPAQLSRFSLAGGSLCACTLEFSMPVTVLTEIGEARANLEVHLMLGRARANGGIDEETLRLALMVHDVCFASVGRTGWFEDELADIQRKLPSGWHLRMCFGCALSDYSPVGHGLFGGLACFRGNKAAYRAVKSKIDLFKIWDSMTEFVQETHLCPEFERRMPETGYRG
jgi:hypothetical protein